MKRCNLFRVNKGLYAEHREPLSVSQERNTQTQNYMFTAKGLKGNVFTPLVTVGSGQNDACMLNTYMFSKAES